MGHFGNSINIGTLAGGRKPVILDAEDRSTHMFVCGATGTGKSKFLESLIRQDILSWSDSKCGLLLLDHHGAVYKAVMQWLAWNGAHWRDMKLPIVPIDLTQNDWVVGYNPLRYRPEMDPWVVVRGLIKSVGHAWGVENMNDTPRLRKWLANIFRTLYDNNLSMLSLGKITDPEEREFRKFLIKRVKDENVARDLRSIDSMRPREFEELVESSVSRLRLFSEGKTIESMMSISDGSLDLHKALEEGQIVLVNLATEGGKVDDEQSKTLATMLLSDLWQCAKMRGKDDARKPKPFYVYVDEFQRYVTPAIVEDFDEARGFGLHMTVACQFPKQIFNSGVHGERLYDSIMASARAKIAFHLGDHKSLELIAQDFFFKTFSPDKVKKELWSTKVMDYAMEYHTAYSRSTSEARSESYTEGDSWTDNEGENSGFHMEDGQPVDPESGAGFLSFLGIGDSEEGIKQYSESLSSAQGGSSSLNQSYSESETFGETESPLLRPIMGRELSSIQFESLDEQLHRSMAVLHDQEQRQFIAKLPKATAPYSVFTPFVESSLSSESMTQRFFVECMERLPFAKDALSAEEHFGEELNRLKVMSDRHARGLDRSDEPQGYAHPFSKPPEEPGDFGNPV